MQRFPGLELALGSEFNECSIIAAELARDVYSLYDFPDNIQSSTLFLASGRETHRTSVQEIDLDIKCQTPSGRTVSLSLIRDGQPSGDTEHPIYLAAIARDNIAFPLASFKRRPGKQCDYVQIGTEIDNADDLVVTPDDEIARKDVIEHLRTLSDVKPSDYTHGERIEAELKGFEPESFLKDLEQKRRFRSIPGTYTFEDKKESCFSIALALHCLGKHFEYNGYKRIGTDLLYGIADSTRTKISDQQAIISNALDGISVTAVLEDKIPLELTAVQKQLVLQWLSSRRTADHRDSSQERTDKILTRRGSAEKVVSALELDDKIDTLLGPFSKNYEAFVTLVGKIALRPTTYRLIEEVQISSTVAEAEIMIDLVPQDSTVTQVAVASRPAAMPESEPVEIYRFNVDHVGMQLVESQTAEEVMDMLKMAIANNNGESIAELQRQYTGA